jgi:hypothetical protein
VGCSRIQFTRLRVTLVTRLQTRPENHCSISGREGRFIVVCILWVKQPERGAKSWDRLSILSSYIHFSVGVHVTLIKPFFSSPLITTA